MHTDATACATAMHAPAEQLSLPAICDRLFCILQMRIAQFMCFAMFGPAELFVWEDDNERTIRFTNARSDGFMKKFDGVWHVQPFTQQTLDSIYKKQPQQQESQHQRFHPAAALAGIQRECSMTGWHGAHSLAYDEP